MDAGRLRDVITLQRPIYTRESGYNSKQLSYVDVIRGGVRGLAKDVSESTSSENNDARQRVNVRRREVEIRWQPNVATTWRLRVNGETHTNAEGDEVPTYFQVVSMADIGGYRDGIRLLVEEYRS